MRYGVLGRLTVFDDVRDCVPAAPRLRTVLALLLARANQVVSTDDLMEELWPRRRPQSAANTLQVFIARLRGLLAPGVAPRDPCQRLVTRSSGYLLRVAPAQLDLHEFEELTEDGEKALAAGDCHSAAETLGRALALWRGAPFADVPTGAGLHLHALQLEERRQRALEQRIEADLALGRHADLVAELETVTAAHPLREGPHAQLMLALCRAGRQAEALAAYQRLRRRLIDDLAIEPSPAVQRLHQAILSGDPALEAPARAVITADPAPGQLPPDVADFTGRGDAVALVERALTVDPAPERTAVPVVVVAGPGGAGKTTLAVHCAHRARPHYPDGQLYLDLRGADSHPLAADDALDRLLRGLGVDGTAIPRTADERAELFRTRTADQRILVLLDNAASEAQVRPLLPGGRRCGVLVTSRSRLPGLSGATVASLGMFHPDEAAALLRRVAGSERLQGQEGAVERLTRLCGHLPLAVRVAGAKLAARPDLSVTRLAERLADERRLLGELTAGDLDVRASIAVSYRSLSPHHKRAFRLLGQCAADVPPWAPAALVDCDPATGESLLDGLLDAQLLQYAGQDAAGQARYRLHDLVRVFAAEQLAAEESPADRREALRRLLTGYATLARAADAALRPGRRPLPGDDSAGAWQPATGHAADRPLEWFAAERFSLLHGIRQSQRLRLASLTGALADNLAGYLEIAGHWNDWEAVAGLALAAARDTGDERAEAAALALFGRLRWDQYRPEEALPYLRDALAICTRTAPVGQQADVLLDLTETHLLLGDVAQATSRLDAGAELVASLGYERGAAQVAYLRARIARYQARSADAAEAAARSAELFRRLGDRRREAYALLLLGTARWNQGESDSASATLQQCLGVLRKRPDRRCASQALFVLGEIRRARRDWTGARAYGSQALTISQELSDESFEAHVRRSLGDLCREEGRLAEAAEHLRRSREIIERRGYRFTLPQTLLSQSDLARAEGRHGEARDLALRSVALFQEQGLPLWEARAQASLGEAYAALGHGDQARERWRASLAILRRISSPEADRVARLLRRATRSDPGGSG